jgi:hypothetical protein
MFIRAGMSSSATDKQTALATRVEVSDDTLSVELADGRTIAAPLAWYPRLAHATSEERQSWRLIGGGRGIHWQAIDEDISVANLLAGQPSAESPKLPEEMASQPSEAVPLQKAYTPALDLMATYAKGKPYSQLSEQP